MSGEERQEAVAEINSQIATGVKAVLITIIPLALAGLVMLVLNHAGQGELKNDMQEMRTEMRAHNERVSIMWAVGGWESKFNTSKE